MWLVLSLVLWALVAMVLVWCVPPWLMRWTQQHKKQFEQSSEHHFAASFVFLRGQEVFKWFMVALGGLVVFFLVNGGLAAVARACDGGGVFLMASVFTSLKTAALTTL